jgi:uncharacterized protein
LEVLFTAPGVSEWMFLGLSVLSFFTAAFGVVAGLGGGVLLLAVMANIFPPAVLIPLHGTIQAGNNVSRSIIMRRHITWGLVPAFALGTLLGAIVGGQVVVALPTALLQTILGVFVLYICWAPKPESHQAYTAPKFFILGAVGTLVSMFVGATGTLLAPFVRAATSGRHEYLASHAVLMVLLHGLKLAAFIALGFEFGAYLPLLAAMIAMAALGNLFGQAVLNKLSEKLFHRLFQVALTLLSLRLLYAGLSGLGYLPKI